VSKKRKFLVFLLCLCFCWSFLFPSLIFAEQGVIAGNNYQGLIDEVRIFDTPFGLSDEQGLIGGTNFQGIIDEVAIYSGELLENRPPGIALSGNWSVHRTEDLIFQLMVIDSNINDENLTTSIFLDNSSVSFTAKNLKTNSSSNHNGSFTAENGIEYQITISKNSYPGKSSFPLKIVAKDSGNYQTVKEVTVNARNTAPTVAFVSIPNFQDNVNYTFSFKASDLDPTDATLTTEVYVGTTKVSTETSNNGANKSVTIDKSKIPVAESFVLKLITKDGAGDTGQASKTINRENRAPTVAFVSTPNFQDNVNYTFSFKATDLDTRIDTTLTTDVYVGTTKVSTETSNNGANKSVTIDKSKIPVAESFVLKVVTKDKKGASAEISKTINRENRAPTVAFVSTPNFQDNVNYTFSFKATDLDTRIDTTLTTDVYVGSTKVSTETSNNGANKSVTIDKSKIPVAESFVLKVVTKDKKGASAEISKTINRENRAPTVAFVSTPNFQDNVNYTFSFKATDLDTRIDTTLTTDVYVGSTKVSTETSNNGANKSVTIDKSKIPAAESFVLKVVTKDKKGASAEISKTINRENRAPTVAFVSTPNFQDNVNYTFSFKATDPDTRIDATLTTDVYVGSTKVSTETSNNGANKSVTIDKSKIPAAESFVLKVVTKDKKGASAEISKTINRENRTPTVAFVSTPNFQDNVNYTFSFKATDPDTRVDATLTTDVYVGSTKVSTETSNNGANKSVTIDKSKIPVAESFVLKVVTKDKKGASAEISKTINRENRAPTVAFVSTPNFQDNVNYTFSFKATDLDTRIDATLTTDVYVGSTKVSTETSNNGANKSVTIDKSKIPVAESFVLKVVTKDKKGASAEISKTINRENRAPTVVIADCPTRVHKRENNLSFKFTASDKDIAIDPILITNIELDGSKVSEKDFEISPGVTISSGNIPAVNGRLYQVTIKNKTKYISTSKDSFTLNVIAKDTKGDTGNKSVSISNFNNPPNISIAKNELSLKDGKIPKHDQTFDFKITASDPDDIDQNLNVKFYIIIDGKSTVVNTFKANSQNITDGNLIASNNQTYTITIDKTIPDGNPLIPNTVNEFTLKVEVSDDLFSTARDEIDLIHFNNLPEIELFNLNDGENIRKSDNILGFDIILKDKDLADTQIEGEFYVKVLDSEQKVTKFTVDDITNNSGLLVAENGRRYSIGLNKGVYVPMFVNEFTIRIVATDTCGDKIEKEITLNHHTDIIARWALDSIKDNIAVDSGGLSNNGIVHGASAINGIIGGAYSFNGVNDYVEVPLSPTLREAITTNSFSVEAWVKTTSAPSSNIGLVTNYGSNTTPFWKLGLEGSSKKFHFELRDKNGVYQNITSSKSMNDGQWHHLVGVRDAEREKARFYVDGVLMGEANAPVGDVNSGQSIFFGFHSNRCFDGCLDEITLYGCALTGADVQKEFERVFYLDNLKMTNLHNDESSRPCTFGVFVNKLDFELKKTVNDLVIELELPSSVKIREVQEIKKKENNTYVSMGRNTIIDSTHPDFEKGVISFVEPLEAGHYRIELLLTVDEYLVIKSKMFYDESKIKINNEKQLFKLEFLDFASLPDLQ
jgi:hypothetical protein